MRRSITTWDRTIGKESFQLFVNEQAPFSKGIVEFSEYDTFISHKGDDTPLAETVGDILYESGLSAYLDKWDSQADGDSPELETHIREVIRKTPSIVAVVTEHTPLSWWVPFELGVARETESQIATFLRVDENSSDVVILPSYLKVWPILTSRLELRGWAAALLSSRSRIGSGRSLFFQKSVEMSADSYNLGGIERMIESGKVHFI